MESTKSHYDPWDFRGVPKGADSYLTEADWESYFLWRRTFAAKRKAELAELESRASRYERREKRKRAKRDLEEQSKELLPGVPDDITVQLISTKLSWTDLRELSTLSSSWLQAMQNRQVYDARVRAKCTESLEVLHHDEDNVFFVCSKTDETAPVRVVLPPISHDVLFCTRFYNRYFGMVSFDGKIYVLGGLQRYSGRCTMRKAITNVFVLDMAGRKNWTECASMPVPLVFGLKHSRCHVKDGKIYVCRECCFGATGTCHGTVCDIYDPKADSWSSGVPIEEANWQPSDLQV